MSVLRVSRLCLLAAFASLTLALTGCALNGGPAMLPGSGSTTIGVGTPRTALGGKVYGGQQPITGATVTLWAAGTSAGYGTGATSIATSTTDSNGNFSFNVGSASPCTTGQYLYITSLGGDPGSGTNSDAAVMAALPTPCGSSTANTFVVVNEVTTVASVTALQQFMSIKPGGSPAWTVGTPSANIVGMANAFTQVGNLVNISTGTSGPTTATNTINTVTYITTITPDSNKINALANVLAACVNTNPASSNTCSSIFGATTPTGSVPPSDTIQVAYYLATNAGGVNFLNSPGQAAYVVGQFVTAQSPFQPYTASPTDWTIDVHWSGVNGTTNAASVAIDGSGNIWTSQLTSSTTGLDVTEFNPAGQVLITPATTAPVVGGWNYSTCTTCSTPVNLGGTHQGDEIAIDTNGNAWATSWNGTTNTISSQIEAPVVEVTASGTATAYLVGYSPAGIVIDGNNDLYIGDGASTSASRYYESELQATPTAYTTLDAGTGRTTNGGYYITGTIDEAGYVWPADTAGETSIPRIYNNYNANPVTYGNASTVGSTTALPSAVYWLAADASGNAWGSTGTTTASATGLEYINVAASTASPTVNSYPIGTNGSTLGGLYGPQGMAIDGSGVLWVVNSGTNGTGISELAPSNNGTNLTALSPSGAGVWGFLSGASLSGPIGAAIDSSGNIWLKTKSGSSLYYLVGAASPVATPLATMVKNNSIAQRPGAPLTATLTSSLTFSAVAGVGQPQAATLTNTGTLAIDIGGITITGANQSDFTVNLVGTGVCSTTVPLAGGASCTIPVIFNSSAAGTFTAMLNVNSTAVIRPGAASLMGTASASAGTIDLQAGTVPPSGPTLNFGTVVAPTATSAQAVVLTNTGSTPMNLTLGMTGTGANLFPQTTNCGSSLAAGASCFVSLKFAPKVAGGYSAALTVTNDAGTGTGASLSGTATPFTITINTSNASAWVIDNGAITFNWNSTTAYLNSWVLDGYSDQLVDTTTLGSGSQVEGLYSGMVGPFMNGTPTSSCTMVGAVIVGTPATPCTTGSGTTPYVDWAITWLDTASTTPGTTANDYTFVWHYVVFPNDPGVHTYVQLVHNASNTNPNTGGSGIGQIQWIFRDNQSIFTHTYEVNSALNWLGAEDIPLPVLSELNTADPGRQVQNAAADLHGFADLPAGFGREFITKYDYAGYEYLHQAHGLYGPASSGTTYGVWTVLPKLETFVGGPTKQDLWFTENIDMIEAQSNHELNQFNMSTAAGVASNRLFGPYYIHVNTLGTAYNQTGNTIASQADMYADAISAGAALVSNYDSVAPLVAAGYVPSNGRGAVTIQANGVSGAAHTAWAVLSDPNTNFQYTNQGMQYWADISASGSATITGVAPGTYRLSVYVLGQWGEYRQDGIVVTANNTTSVPALTFQPETFTNVNGTASGETVFTIGTPDRSSHEFLHGKNAATGNDDREFWGNWNYWADFMANQGAVVYYATAVGGTPATNDLTKWNYVHWGSGNYNPGDPTATPPVAPSGAGSFHPGLYGGVFSSSDDTTDGYAAYPGQTYPGISGMGAESAIPSYVAGLSNTAGTNGVDTSIPAWQVYFATPNDIASYGSGYAQLSVAMACDYGSNVVNLNGHQLIWSRANYSDCFIRSGLSGYTEWYVMEFPASYLNQTPGGSNEITISVTQEGLEDDAWRLELTNNTSNPATTGWNDYTYVSPSTTTAPNDAIPNP